MTDPKFNDIIQRLYYDRDEHSIKSDYGKTLLIGGSKNYPLAVVIASHFASLSGNGYTALCVPEEIYSGVVSRANETEIFASYDIKDWSKLLTYSAILFGNGLEENKTNQELLQFLLKYYQGKLVIDATGIRILAGLKDIDQHRCELVLTPHLGEASYLLKEEKKTRNPMDLVSKAKEFAKKNNLYILLKSFTSILVNPKEECVTSDYETTAALAHAGSGDGLAGYLSGLLAYAESKISFADTILFADDMIHRAAKMAEKEYSPGLANILSCREEIIQIIKKAIR